MTHVFWYNERDEQSGSTQLDGYGLLRADLSAKPSFGIVRDHLNS